MRIVEGVRTHDVLLPGRFSRRPLRANGPSATGGVNPSTGLPPFLTDLRAEFQKGKILPAPLRAEIIGRINEVLTRPKNNSVLLAGKPGVGKSRILDHFVHGVCSGNDRVFAEVRILRLDIDGICQGRKPEAIENNFAELQRIVREEKTIIVVEGVHRLFEIQGGAGRIIDSLEGALKTGVLTILGATTNESYESVITRDKSPARQFTRIEVEEPTIDLTVRILKEDKTANERYFSQLAGKPIEISDTAIRKAAELSVKYIGNKALPDKAREVLEAAVTSRIDQPGNLKRRIEQVLIEIVIELNTRAAAPEERTRSKKNVTALVEKYFQLKRELLGISQQDKLVIGEGEVLRAISNICGISPNKLSEDEVTKIRNLEEILHRRIKGQEEAVKKLADAVRRAYFIKEDPMKPNLVFFFAGPTGVGKTETARALAEALFGDEKALLRFDMGEYNGKDSINRFSGSAPGYIGFGLPSVFDPVRQRPQMVVLLDEFEKAHPEVFKTFMGIFDCGRYTTAANDVIDFKDTFIIMTSNLGASEIMDAIRDLKDPAEINKKIKTIFAEHLKGQFPPEFVKRIQETIFFQPIDSELADEILQHKIQKRADEFRKNYRILFSVDEGARRFLVDSSQDWDGRSLLNTIERLIIKEITDRYYKGELGSKPGRAKKVSVGTKDGQLEFQIEDVPYQEEVIIPGKLGGRSGMVISDLLTLVDNPPAGDITLADVRKRLQVTKETLLEYLRQQGDVAPQKTELANFDPRTKDPQVASAIGRIKGLLASLSLRAGAEEAIQSWVRIFSVFAKKANAGKKSRLVRIESDVDTNELFVKISCPVLDPADQQKITANFMEPKPRSEEERDQIARQLGLNGDLALLDLKRKILDVRGEIGCDVRPAETTLWIRFPLTELEFSSVDVRFSNLNDAETVGFCLKSKQFDEALEVARASGNRELELKLFKDALLADRFDWVKTHATADDLGLELYNSFLKDQNPLRAAECLRLVRDLELRRQQSMILINNSLSSQDPKSADLIKALVEDMAKDLGTKSAAVMLNAILSMVTGLAEKMWMEDRIDKCIWLYKQMFFAIFHLEVDNLESTEDDLTNRIGIIFSRFQRDSLRGLIEELILSEPPPIPSRWFDRIIQDLVFFGGAKITSLVLRIKNSYLLARGLVIIAESIREKETVPSILEYASAALKDYSDKYPQTEQTQKQVSDLRARIETLKKTLFDRLMSENKYGKAMGVARLEENPVEKLMAIYVAARAVDRDSSGSAWNTALDYIKKTDTWDEHIHLIVAAEIQLNLFTSALGMLDKNCRYRDIIENLAIDIFSAAIKAGKFEDLYSYIIEQNDCGEKGCYPNIEHIYYRAFYLFLLANTYHGERGRNRRLQGLISNAHQILDDYENHYVMNDNSRKDIRELRRKLAILRAAMNSGQKPVY
ncbi:MAG: AAA family ATPase [Candidatus Margulisiibacteriota bacterium]